MTQCCCAAKHENPCLKGHAHTTNDGDIGKADLDDVLQEGHGLVNGRFSIKGISNRHLVRQDSLKAAGQGLGLLLQLHPLLLHGCCVLFQLLIVPVHAPLHVDKVS